MGSLVQPASAHKHQSIGHASRTYCWRHSGRHKASQHAMLSFTTSMRRWISCASIARAFANAAGRSDRSPACRMTYSSPSLSTVRRRAHRRRRTSMNRRSGCSICFLPCLHFRRHVGTGATSRLRRPCCGRACPCICPGWSPWPYPVLEIVTYISIGRQRLVPSEHGTPTPLLPCCPHSLTSRGYGRLA
jgi:hypothetical protein